MNIIKYSSILFICIFLGGCGRTIIKDIHDWAKVDIKPSNDKTSLPIFSSTPKVVVEVFIEPNSESAKELSSLANLPTVMAGQIEANITTVGVELVTRNAAAVLLDEVILAETKGEVGQYKGPEVAQYAIVARIDGVDISHQFNETSSLDGLFSLVSSACRAQGLSRSDCHIDKTQKSAQCIYKAEVTGIIHIYSIPKLKIIKSIQIQKSASRTEDTPYKTCSIQKSDYVVLIRKAGEKAIDEQRMDFQNFFAQTGYIREMRFKDKEYIIKINLGREQGLVKGTRINIFRKESSEEIEEEVKVASGEVTNEIMRNHAWVHLNKAEFAHLIETNDFVKPFFKLKSIWDNFPNLPF